MSDVMREQGMTFDQWCATYEPLDGEEKMRMSKAAQNLEKNQSYRRVLGEIEKNVIRKWVNSDLLDWEKQTQYKNLLDAVRSVRREIRRIAEIEEYEQKLASKQ